MASPVNAKGLLNATVQDMNVTKEQIIAVMTAYQNELDEADGYRSARTSFLKDAIEDLGKSVESLETSIDRVQDIIDQITA
jgi:uncharacterized protein YoxC